MRFVVAAVLVSLIFVYEASAAPQKPGSLEARWPIKTSLAPGADLSRSVPEDFAKLAGLPDIPGVKAKDPRYPNKRIPTPVDGLREGQIVTMTGYVHVVACETDGDYHIQVTGSPTSGDHCLIVELPYDDPAYESVASLRAKFGPLR